MATARKPRDSSGTIRRLIRVVREEGVRAASIKILHELKIYRRVYLLEIPNEDAASPAGSDLPMDVSVLEVDQLHEYLAFRPDQVPDDIRCRLADGHWCFVGRHEGRIITSAWACADSASIDYLECRIKLPDRVVFTYDVYTDPAYRGHRASTVVFDWRRRYLRESGFPRGVGILWPENEPAARRLAHRAHSVFGTLGTWRVAGWKRHVLRTSPDALEDGDPLVSLEGG